VTIFSEVQKRALKGPRKSSGILLILFACLLTPLIANHFYQNWQFRGTVGYADAIVDRVDDSTIGRPSFLVDYHYVVQGKTYAKHQHISRMTWNEWHGRVTLPVKYLPTEPSVSRINLPSEDQHQQNLGYSILALIVFLFGLGWWRFRRWESEYQG
jgi:hypothetical protein